MAVDRSALKANPLNVILTALICSTEFCREVAPVIKPEYFDEPPAQTIAKWCIEHFKDTGQAIGKGIQHAFELECRKMDETESDILLHVLNNLNDNYAPAIESAQFNAQYHIKKAKRFLFKNAMQHAIANAEVHLDKGRVDEAYAELSSVKTVSNIVSHIKDISDDSLITDIFYKEDSQFFKFPGGLGDMIGPMERGWLVSWFGPMKRGKSNWLMETAVQGAQRGLNVVVFSHEMSQRDWTKRLITRLVAKGSKEGQSTIPRFDCIKNKEDRCTHTYRTNSRPFGDLRYKACTYCRTIRYDRDFEPVSFLEQRQVKPMTTQEALKAHARWTKRLKNKFKIVCYPRFSATFDDLERDLDNMYNSCGFVPDLIIDDYFDIHAQEVRGKNPLENTDAIWKRGGRLATERNCLLTTCCQTQRNTLKGEVTPDTISDDIRKLAHIDIGLGLCQTPEEKREKLMRVNVLGHRHADFDHENHCTVLQNIEHGQVLLDSFWR